ncbi:MAG: hypothetical protein OXQ29_13080 [Rhodospirillaceae bacterium]|nr:hypothetical protein [Rhodospirillaceae bacterium]
MLLHALQLPASAQVVTPESHLGGCILHSPAHDLPADPYLVTDVISTDEYPPFVKKLSAYGLTLVAREDISDDFMRLVGRTIAEMFPQAPEMDLAMQAEVLANHHMYGAVIPVPMGRDYSFMETNADDWARLESENSVCDVIMQGVRGQVMEVVEHILHYVSDIGLHYAYPDEWGFGPDSTIVQGMRDAVDSGYYVISQYSDIDDLEVRERVLVQEFAYWVITTAWDLQEDYGPREVEWQVTDRDDLRAKLPEMDALMERTVDRIMVAPSRATLEEIGLTRARPISGLIQFLRRTLAEFGPTGTEESN